MPRVAQMPRSGSVRSVSGSLSSIPLNDDAEERGKRINSRKALHDKQINQLKAAASGSRRTSLGIDDIENAAPGSNAGTPRASRGLDLSDDPIVINGVNLTPVKRVPILANFEEWMKMATDNKINATNSWNFALIDYFHDMSLLKEGDGVNFQKASCTLDGCVKIYTNRVDSVATETGKLLSGLADSNSKKKADSEEGNGGESEDEVDEDGNVKKKPKKKSQRSEATLAPSFASLQLKKFELEFSVDPLFKKASADFDEGGAKGLLLNHLMIDSQGRIVFDSSDDTDAVDTGADKKEEEEADMDLDEDENLESDISQLQSDVEALHIEEGEHEDDPHDVEIDLTGLRQRYFPDLSRLEDFDVCPSLKNFELGDPSGSMDIPFLKAPEDWCGDEDGRLPGAFGDNSGMLIDGDAPMGFDDDDLGLGSFDIGDDVAFGEGGEAWAREAALEPQMRVYDNPVAGDDDADEDEYDENGDYIISVSNPQNADKMHQDILSFFDQALQKNWTNAEHWRIRKIKDTSKPASDTPKKRKEKEPFEVDFGSALGSSLTDALYTQAASNATISLAKKDWKSKSRNLLPDDKHFNSKSLLSLFLKPKARLIQRSTGNPRRVFGGVGVNTDMDNQPLGELDEAFWAEQKAPEETALPGGDYDANFFQDDALPFAGGGADDDDDDDMEFADAQEHLGGAGADMGLTENVGGMTAMFGGDTMANPMGAFGDTLVAATRRVRPEYVQYARVAKKVDIRRLKDEIWKGMGLEALQTPPAMPADEPAGRRSLSEQPRPPQQPLEDPTTNPTLKFTKVMNDLQRVYPKPAMNDISTSYCFISLLHLANERGLVISTTEDLRELEIRKDWTAEVIEGEA
ncbi:condensin complex component cnd2 [Cordyceps fumosorosea ARSEF 2679]|uniref:Condensin complex subunit 2 n=1 Tax=Cordyceps fumosorosea (strain ARSEF 2679) TaxID=1081104 RepID=A0A168B1C5_CORFA|nr:condensin complex component cnd2 [Cordyceps fumosorosea ARSEF 2679]OAA69481.1 condensin complex component cnd2 [Cordyceps fumosorosea ARSEF 2679]